VQVRLLASHWNYSSPQMWQYLASLNQLDNVEVRLYTVPSVPDEFPYTRVNHAKYMVTDKATYIGTSNWTGDYFVYTGGVSVNSENPAMIAQLQAVFDRDWNSPYSSPAVHIRSFFTCSCIPIFLFDSDSRVRRIIPIHLCRLSPRRQRCACEQLSDETNFFLCMCAGIQALISPKKSTKLLCIVSSHSPLSVTAHVHDFS
jgi:hypothetical protein